MSTTNAQRLARLANGGRWGCWLGAGGLVALTWTHIWTEPMQVVAAPLGFASLDHAAPWQFVLVRIIACGVSAAAAASLLALAACFRAMTLEHPFAAMAPALARFATAVLVAVVVAALTTPLSCLILSAGAGPGQGRLVVSLGANHAFVFLAAVAFFALARLSREAVRIERENAEFV